MDDLRRVSTGDQATARATDIGAQTLAFYTSLDGLPDDLRNDLTQGFHEFVLIERFGVPEQVIHVHSEDE